MHYPSIPVLPVLLCGAMLLACGSDDGQDSAVDAGLEFDATAAICPTTPARLVVLGDSIAACFGVGGGDAATCGPKIFHDSLAANQAPGIVYQHHAVSGAVVTDVPDLQLATVPTGPGHAMVLIYVGGNDLNAFLTSTDEAAITGLANALPGIQEDWDAIFAFFDDSANFPDGATIVMNNQYNPFDDCTAPPYNLSQRKAELLREYNDFMADIADAHDNAVLTDQWTPYLGHGHHFSVTTCPYYEAGKEGWMQDLIHPNISGHANLAEQWKSVANTWFAGCQ